MIAWEESGGGVPAVLVHGNTEDRRVWDTVVPLLEDRFRCVRLDLRGHGASDDADDYSPLAMTDDVVAVVAEAGIDEPPLVVGHSLGAMVATAYAARAPVRAIVNVDQSLRLGDFAEALQPLAADLRGERFHDALAQLFDDLGSDGVPDDVRAYLAERHAAARQKVVVAIWAAVFETPPAALTALAESLLGALRVPYLAIHGTDPGPGYEAWLQSLVPGAVVERWERGGHYPHLADPARFAARLSKLVG